MAPMSDEQFNALLERIRETTGAISAQSAPPPAPEQTEQEQWAARFYSAERTRPPFDARAILTDMAERETATAPPWSKAA